MDSGKVAMAIVSTVTLLCVVVSISAKPTLDQQWINQPISHYELHPIDNCIFACDHCYKEDALVKCANECILSEAAMSVEWTNTCPYLSRQFTHPVANNPFRH